MMSDSKLTARQKPSRGVKVAFILCGTLILLLVGALGVTLGMLLGGSPAPQGNATTAESQPAPSSDVSGTDEQDDSAALSALVTARDSVMESQETKAIEDCLALASAAAAMDRATPLDSYRGQYEKIAETLRTISATCGDESLERETQIVMKSTRGQAVGILNDREYLGMSSWQ